ncbi:hypothetical protein GCM10009804_11130 [Kribbella hippodromi]|uniref:Uncharacterized protein n=1 Tax=Kribbella hippodromi TaxID=434347 RepID=A0ABN2CC08_9ACTN
MLILSPAEDRGPKGGILSLHGGGMIMGGRGDHVSHEAGVSVDLHMWGGGAFKGPT